MSEFAKGYQAALRDLADANERGGADAVFQWLYDNGDATVQQLVRHMVKGQQP